MNIGLLAALMVSAAGAVTVQDDGLVAGRPALVVGDYVRVRSVPSSKEEDQIGWLYKNMVVKVLEVSKETATVGGKKYRWCRVERETLRGWTLSKFLNPDVPPNVDTYDAPGDMEWFYTKFGSGTAYEVVPLDVGSFNIEEYRNLMKVASTGNTAAITVLSRTILAHLRDYPDDPAYAYLKDRLYSPEYLLTLPAWSISDDLYPPELHSNRAFIMRLASGGTHAACRLISNELVADRAFVKELLSLRNDTVTCLPIDKKTALELLKDDQDWHLLGRIPLHLGDDPDVMGAAIQRDGCILGTGGVLVRRNKSLALKAVKTCPSVAQQLDVTLQSDQDVLIELSRAKYRMSPAGTDFINPFHFPARARGTRKVMLAVAKAWQKDPGNCNFLPLLHPGLRSDGAFMKELAAANKHCPSTAP